MTRKNIAKTIISLILTTALSITIIGCSSEEQSPVDGNDSVATDETTDPTEQQDTTADTADTVTSTTEDGSDTSTEASGTGSASTTGNSTTKPATTTAQSGNSPAATTTSKPSATSTTTAAQTTKPVATTTTAHVHEYYIWRTGSVKSVIGGKTTITNTTTYKCVCGDSYSEKVTTDGDGNVISDGDSTAPAVTTTTAPAVTTTTAPAPAHTHSYSSKVTKEATCTATGTMTYTCSCGDKYTESIPAKGHDWKTETIHHDAEYGTRDKTEQWVKVTWYVWIRLTQAGIDAGLGSTEYPNYYKVLAAQYWGKPNDPSSVEWIYRYDNSSDPVASCAGYYCADFTRKGYGNGTYNATDHYEYENRVVGTETYVIKDAYDETVTTCATCGTKK